MHTSDGVGNSVHDIDIMKFCVFSFAFRDVDTYKKVLAIPYMKIVWMQSDLHHPLMMSQC